MSSAPQRSHTHRPHRYGLTAGQACYARAGDCRCNGEHSLGGFGHAKVHQCGVARCGAQWRFNMSEQHFDPVAMPNLAPPLRRIPTAMRSH